MTTLHKSWYRDNLCKDSYVLGAKLWGSQKNILRLMGVIDKEISKMNEEEEDYKRQWRAVE